MNFKLRKDARDWFSELRGKEGFTTDFDIYYFCPMAGLAASRKHEDASGSLVEIVDDFPVGAKGTAYKEKSRLLMALLLTTELRGQGISLERSDDVSGFLFRFLDSNSPSRLSDYGVSAMNEYASGGLDVLKEKFSDKPRSIELFVRVYRKVITETMSSASQVTRADG